MRVPHIITRVPNTPNRTIAISAQIYDTDSQGESYLRYDFTGERAVLFPDIWLQLRDDQQDALIQLIAPWLVEMLVQ